MLLFSCIFKLPLSLYSVNRRNKCFNGDLSVSGWAYRKTMQTIQPNKHCALCGREFMLDNDFTEEFALSGCMYELSGCMYALYILPWLSRAHIKLFTSILSEVFVQSRVNQQPFFSFLSEISAQTWLHSDLKIWGGSRMGGQETLLLTENLFKY